MDSETPKVETETPKVASETPQAAVAEMDIEVVLQGVVKKSMIHDGLARGLNETVKALDRREAKICILSDDCDREQYVNLITALCNEHKIPLLKVDDSKKLGAWCGLCKIDDEGKARKVVGCTSCAIKKWGIQSDERDRLVAYLESKGYVFRSN